MTNLTIKIYAEDDHEALRVLHRLHNMMDVCSGEDCGIHLNDAGYTSSHVAGSGEVIVRKGNNEFTGLRCDPQGSF